MQYKYVPDTINKDILNNKNIDEDEFLNMQLLYRKNLENLLKKYLDFKKIDLLMNSIGFTIPPIEDLEYNFYHKFSNLGSKYFFLRNNIHVENLSDDEYKILKFSLFDNGNLKEEFILETFPKVLFEDSGMFGIPIVENMVKENSLIIEFAYNEIKCNLDEGVKVRQAYEKMIKLIEPIIVKNLKCSVSFICYNGFGNIYKE